MSADTGGIGSAREGGSDLGFKDALLIAAAVMGLLIFLVVLRFCLNLMIDVCLLDRLDRAQRAVAEVLRKICPFWHVRTQPTQPPTPAASTARGEGDIELGRGRSRDAAMAETATSLSIVNERALELLRQLLPGKIVTASDFEDWKDKHDRYNRDQHSPISNENQQSHPEHADFTGSGTGGVVCSICLHDLERGDVSYTAPDCLHTFHQDCIMEWMVNSRRRSGTDCPYCRTPIIAQTALHRVLRIASTTPSQLNTSLRQHETQQQQQPRQQEEDREQQQQTEEQNTSLHGNSSQEQQDSPPQQQQHETEQQIELEQEAEVEHRSEHDQQARNN